MCEWALVDGGPPFKDLIIQITECLMSVPHGDQINKQNADTRQECLHRSYSFSQLLYHWSQILSSKPEHSPLSTYRVKKCGAPMVFRSKIEGVMERYHPIQKRCSLGRHCNVFALKKHCGTTSFFYGFRWGNTVPCQTPKMALSALHFCLFCRFYLTNK